MKKKKFIVTVSRISYSSRNIEVKATSIKKAKEAALDEAGSHEFTEHDADYKVDCVGEVKPKPKSKPYSSYFKA